MDHNNYYFLSHLSARLGEVLQGALFVEAYSTSKHELWLVFKTTSGEYFPIKCNFITTDTVLSFPAEIPYPKRKQPWFGQLEAQQVKTITQQPFDRSFYICLGEDFILYIKLYGKNGNVLLFKGDTLVDIFRKQIKADVAVTFSGLTKDRKVDVEELLLTSAQDELPKRLPFFPPDAIRELERKDFFNQSTQQKQKIAETTLARLETSYFFICKMNDEYRLQFFAEGEVLGEYVDAIQTQNDFARLYLGNYFFHDKKQQLLQPLRQRKDKLEREIHSKKTKLEKLAELTPYNQVGDILMANLHLLNKGQETATLFDFYANKEISIKIKKDLSPQENAANYYRKAKNQNKETELLEKRLAEAETELQEVKAQLEKALQADDSKALRGLEKEKPVEEEKQTLFKEFEKSGYTIWVGKNSENNDVLTQKYAHKNDIWLHARGMAGSHVVIRHKPGQTIPNDVLEYAASLAAFFSKGRNESLCPVIYTEKKFVRKPKGAHPGQVVVEKEKTLLVKPAFGD